MTRDKREVPIAEVIEEIDADSISDPDAETAFFQRVGEEPPPRSSETGAPPGMPTVAPVEMPGFDPPLLPILCVALLLIVLAL